ncbi:MAG: copper amine oxidase N-terminal domain-containing protein [Firmicutes bacterium]|nr:copper amine oxidase N-terminal domain-containing protein [Bacillota bacterium]
MKKRICAAALSLALSFQLFPTSTALASSVDEAVEKIKQQDNYSQLVDDLTSTGEATQQDVDKFVTDVVSNLDGEQITEENIKSKVKEAATEALSSNSNMIDAVVAGLDEEDIDALRNDQLPSSLSSIGDIFKQELLGSESPTVGGGGGAGALPANNDSTNVISEDYIEKKINTKEDGTTVQEVKINRDAIEQIRTIKENGKELVEINVETKEADITVVNVDKEVIKTAEGLSMAITSPEATLQLPEELVKTLTEQGEDITVTMSAGDVNLVNTNMNGVTGARGAKVLGTPMEIDTNYQGKTNVSISLSGIQIPTDDVKRQNFLNNLAVFIIHNDGQKQVVKGKIVLDEDNEPTALSFEVDKFSTFAIIKQAKYTKEIKLTIGAKQASISGSSYTLDAVPYIKAQASRTMVPIRFISEALGSEVIWKPQTRQVVINRDETQIILTINLDKVQVNGTEQQLDAPTEIVKNRTFIPLRFVSETLGAIVDYDSTNQEIKIQQ